jgi:DNA mismatch endonuclease (patch repair protein)
VDTVDRQTRSKIMASVRQKNTGAELLLRKRLHGIGLRYRLHDRSLPGSPDLVFPRFHAVVFVHGCYWHSHGCYRSTVPETRHEFWIEKFQRNRSRDQRNENSLLHSGWRVLAVWECALLGKSALPPNEVTGRIHAWLHGADRQGQVSGNLGGVLPLRLIPDEQVICSATLEGLTARFTKT